MISIPNLFSRVDRFFDKKQGNKDLNPEEEAEIRYMFLQGIVAPILTIVLGIVAWAISAKLVLEFSVVYFFSFFIASQIFKKLFRDFATTVLAFKTLMILLVSIYIMRMGGVLTSGGMFLLAVQAVTSSIISQKSWHNIFIISIFIVCMSLLIAFQSYFPTENALTPKQNLIIFAMSILSMTIYIFFFSLYAINILTKMEQRETQRQKELNDAKTRLYTNITHEFRTPLTVIHGLADSVKNNEQNNLSGKMETIIKNGKNLLQLVDQMLDLNKMESGQMLVNKISANIIPFLKYVFQLQEFYAEEKNISMVFNSKSQSFELEFDPEKTAAIVSNLLSNAIKFTPEGGQISMRVYHADENICIEIKDNGIGIPQEKLETIFDRFYQVDGTNTRKEGGAGIGLAITREFVNLLNGSIEVKSSTSLGTIFTVKLPYIPGNEKSTAIEALEEETESWEDSSDPHELFHATSNGHHRLLIIEDNSDVIGYLKACYQNHFSIHVAKDGKEGYKLAIEEIPDIIISDIMMPEMDGFELCKNLKDDLRTSHIPIILLTAKADIPSRIEGLETGADAYIVKPFNQRELLVRMQKLLELRRKLFQRYNNGNGLEDSNDPLIQKEDRFYKKLNEIIQNNLEDESFNIHALCREMGLSKSQLYRKFGALTTLSVAKYIRTLRMKKARELLLNSDLNITEVGYEVGMKSVSVFSKLFKEEFGLNPSDFVHQKLTTNELK